MNPVVREELSMVLNPELRGATVIVCTCSLTDKLLNFWLKNLTPVFATDDNKTITDSLRSLFGVLNSFYSNSVAQKI